MGGVPKAENLFFLRGFYTVVYSSLQISVPQQLFFGVRSYVIRLPAKCTRLSSQHSWLYFKNVSLGIK